MPRRPKTRKRATQTSKVERTVKDVAALGSRIDAFVRPAATAVGWAGIVALAALGLLSGAPPEEWPDVLDPGKLAVYTTLALVAASLLGWSFMQEGQARIMRKTGRGTGLVLFVFLPLAAALVGLVEGHAPLEPATRAEFATAFWIARWYSPAAVVASVAAFLAAKSGRTIRGVWYAALLTPYCVLLGALVFGFRFPWIEVPLRTTLGALGGGAVAMQIVLAWFVGGSW